MLFSEVCSCSVFADKRHRILSSLAVFWLQSQTQAYAHFSSFRLPGFSLAFYPPTPRQSPIFSSVCLICHLFMLQVYVFISLPVLVCYFPFLLVVFLFPISLLLLPPLSFQKGGLFLFLFLFVQTSCVVSFLSRFCLFRCFGSVLFPVPYVLQ